MEVDTAQPQRSLQHLDLVCGPSESKDPETTLQVLRQEGHCGFVNPCHMSTESSKRWSERHCCGWHCHPHALGPILFPSAIFLAVPPMLPGHARAVCFHHTSHDLVSSGKEPCCLASLAKVCLSISGFVPPVPHPAPKEEVPSAA